MCFATEAEKFQTEVKKEKSVANKEEEFRRHQVPDVKVCATNKSKQPNQPHEENIHVSQTLRVCCELQNDWRSVNSVSCVWMCKVNLRDEKEKNYDDDVEEE